MKFSKVIAVVLAILMAISKADPPTIEVGNPPNYEVSIKFKNLFFDPFLFTHGELITISSKTFLGSLVIPQAKLFRVTYCAEIFCKNIHL